MISFFKRKAEELLSLKGILKIRSTSGNKTGMKPWGKLMLYILALGLPTLCFSQNNKKPVSVSINFPDSASIPDFSRIRKQFSSDKIYRDSTEAVQDVEDLIQKLQGNGYLSASVDSIHRREQVLFVDMHIGPMFQWTRLEKGNVEDAYLSGSRYRQKLYNEKPFRYVQVRQMMETILKNCENNGYPFATLRLADIRNDSNAFSAELHLEKNKLVRIDSVALRGNATIAPVYIYNYIGIRPGAIYNEALIARISNRLTELPFLREIRPYRVLFSEKDTKLELFLENKKASQFDGVIGLLPDENKTGKLTVTGEAHLKLQNSLKRGEIIELNWKQLPVRTQDLKIHALYPFLFNTPFGLDGNLILYKKDTIYVDVTKNLGIQYNFSGNTFVKAFITDKQSNLQSTAGLEFITVLPSYADVSSVNYGATVHIEKLDYRLNPRKGYLLEMTGMAGTRKIHKNSGINPEVYDSLTLSTNTYHGEGSVDYYISPGGRHVFDFGVTGGYMYNPEAFVNELFRIGGLRSLRGFDEESIYASSYGIGKIEYRYLLEQNSFLFLFYNRAWYEDRQKNSYLKDTPYGFGAGINFEIKLGIMSVSYALGKQFDNPLYVKNGKVHFGIVNYF